jgi:hypothetical protein
MTNWQTSGAGFAMILVALYFCAYTRVLDSSEGKALIAALAAAGFGFIKAKDAGKP